MNLSTRCVPINTRRSHSKQFSLFAIPTVSRMSTTARVLLALAILQLASAQTPKFSSNLFWEVVKDNSKKNVIVSPFSIETALTITYLGADGDTGRELASTLGLPSSDKEKQAEYYGNLAKLSTGGAEVTVANRIYVSSAYTLRPNFNELITKHFSSEAQSIDFNKKREAAATINKWVAEKTNNKITDILNPDSLDGALTSFIIANAIYFKAAWAKAFNERVTRKKPFWVTSSKSVDVNTMTVVDTFRFADIPEWGATVLEVPYDNTDISFLIILPNSRDGLADVEMKMGLTPIEDWSTKLEAKYIKLFLPKFKIEFGLRLDDVLKALGIRLMFNDGADLSGIVDTSQPTKVSQVQHKGYLVVDENGSEAAAATIVVGESRVAKVEKEQNFIVDHPFAFVIRNAMNVYFAGHVVDL